MGVGKAGVGQIVPNQERTSSLVLAVTYIESPQTLIVMAFPTKQKCLLCVSGEPPITNCVVANRQCISCQLHYKYMAA